MTEELLAGLDLPGLHSSTDQSSPAPTDQSAEAFTPYSPSPPSEELFDSTTAEQSLNSPPAEPQQTRTVRQPFSDITNTSDVYQVSVNNSYNHTCTWHIQMYHRTCTVTFLLSVGHFLRSADTTHFHSCIPSCTHLSAARFPQDMAGGTI